MTIKNTLCKKALSQLIEYFSKNQIVFLQADIGSFLPLKMMRVKILFLHACKIMKTSPYGRLAFINNNKTVVTILTDMYWLRVKPSTL